MLTPRDAWQATLGQLQLQLNRATFDTWLKGSEVLAYEDGEFIIRVRHAYAKDWLEKHLHHQITQTLAQIFGRSVQINYVVYLPNHRQIQARPGMLWKNAQAAPQTSTSTESGESVETLPAYFAPEEENTRPVYPEWDPRFTDLRSPASTASEPLPLAESGLNRRYTFEHFVVGPCNQFAYAAAQSIAEAANPLYNPLFIYGGPGLGKTHLLHAIGNAAQDCGRRTLYLTAESFTNDLVTAIRAHTTAEFRERYREVDLLLVDDIQFIAGKASTEEEFYHTFNAIFSRGGQIVVAGDRHPRTMKTLDERLRSRFEGGLQADLQVPEQETRRAILEAKSAAQGRTLPPDVADLLARRETTSVRELEGILTQVLARAALARQPLTLTLAEMVLEKNGGLTGRRGTKLDQILEAAATYHQLSLDDLVGKSRTREVARARHIAIYLAREETEASLPQIGEALGGRNHSTVLHGYQKIAEEIEGDEDLKREVSAIRRQLYLLPGG